MTLWLHLTEERRRQIIVAVAEDRGMSEEAAEKDWWVTLVLKAAFITAWANDLVFKGGTSLSKGWNLIDRFSEDIDLAISRSALGFNDDFVSNSQVKKLRKEASAFVCGPFREGLQTALEKFGVPADVFTLTVQESNVSDRDPQVLELTYPSVIGRGHYISDKVLIEVGARSLREPCLQRPIRSIIGETFPEQEWADQPFHISIVEPQRTFLEKAFLLHEGFLSGAETFPPERKSRHLYDLERLMDTEHAEAALQNQELYRTIIEHRRHFTPVRGLSYERHEPSFIEFVPPPQVQAVWKEDYRRMTESMTYGEAPDFTLLMLRLQELQVRFRLMNETHKFDVLKSQALNNYPKDELPTGEGDSITYNIHFVRKPSQPSRPVNETITYRLSLTRHNGTWYATDVEIKRPEFAGGNSAR